MKNLITIVIPFYNRKATLKRCIKSALSQSYFDIQVLLVDDGSTDESLELANKFKAKDPRVKIVSYKPNRGVSHARNIALENIDGDLFVFLDSDDWLPKKSIETLYKNLIANDSDYVVGSMRIVGPLRSISDNVLPLNFTTDNPVQMFFKERKYKIHSAKKILKTKIVKNYKIRFRENIDCGEDAIFMIEYLSHCNRITSINDIVYFNNRLLEGTNGVGRYYPNKHLWGEIRLNEFKKCLDHYALNEGEKKAILTSDAIETLIRNCEHNILLASNEIDKIAKIKECFEHAHPFIDLSTCGDISKTNLDKYKMIVEICCGKAFIDDYIKKYLSINNSRLKNFFKKIIGKLKYAMLFH